MKEKEPVDVPKREKNFTRGRNYLIYLLAARDYTIKEVEKKLQKADYPEEVIAQVIQYGIERHYLDDMRYAKDYIRCKKGTKSVRQLKYQLAQKGVAAFLLDQIEEEDDRENMKELVSRYRAKKTGSDYEKNGKTYQYFVRKGYSPGLIKEILRDLS